ncbi:ThyX-like thymidylate synthase [Rhodobacter phage RcZahn]|nr:ThyX-like thymidylate synthase [Rhodobacter phage RcZahn]
MQAERLTRTHSEFLDEHLGNPTPVLDHGFVRVIDYMGDDAAVVQAARVSYGKGTESVSTDRGLIRYLMRHWHSTPFEMCEIKLHVKLPIFVARQWIRHRTANVNEYSARYSILDREFYIPVAEQLAVQSTSNKQGRAEELTPDQALQVQAILMHDASTAYDSYERMLRPKDEGGEFGLARELARMNLPANVYTQWYWKVDLHNLLHFLRLRADPHAQWEIRQYANVICDLVAGWVPYVWEAFNDYRLQGVQLSAMEVKFLRDLLADDPHDWLCEDQAKTYGMTSREAQEFVAKFKTGNG